MGMTVYAYEMRVPDDVAEDDLGGFREVAISTWRTGSEGMGGSPGEPRATLKTLDEPVGVIDSITGEVIETCSRVWRIEGEVT